MPRDPIPRRAGEPEQGRSTARPSLLMVATMAGTIQAFLSPYAAHFRALGWRVAAGANGVAENPRLTAAFDRVHELPLTRSLRDVRGLRRAWRVLEEILEPPPDIVHVHTPIASFMTRLVARRLPREQRPIVVYTAHGFHFHEGGHPVTNAVFLTAERIAGRWTDRLIVINDEDEAAARRHRIVPESTSFACPGSVSILTASRPRRSTRSPSSGFATSLECRAMRLSSPLSVSCNRNKRQADALAAIAAMGHPDAHLVLAGRGPTRTALEAQARDAGVADRVHILGEVDDIRPFVRAATALLLH